MTGPSSSASREIVNAWVPCIPPKTTHHAKRIVFPKGSRFARLADTAGLRDTKAFWYEVLTQIRPASGLPVEGPMSLELDLVWPFLTSHSKRFRAQPVAWYTTKPDCDNLAKAITDQMVRAGYFANDARIAVLTVTKRHGEQPGVRIVLRTLTE